jgi:hypothetical protein
MAFWKRRKGQQRREERPAPLPGGLGGFVPSGYGGKQVVRIGDPALWAREDALRNAAESELDPDDESYARELVDLLEDYASEKGAPKDAIEAAVQELGREICRDGGKDRMKLIAFRVSVLGAGNVYTRVRSMESFWDGICGWQV